MAVREVVELPHAVLRTPTREITDIDDAARALAVDLVETMRVSPGCVGLAANQIGISMRAFCLDVTGHKKAKSVHGLFVLFNPVILSKEGKTHGREGCMSVPSLTGDVDRAAQLVLQGITPEGEERVLHVDAFEARAVQHEVDHLDGLLFLDRVGAPDGIFPRKVYR